MYLGKLIQILDNHKSFRLWFNVFIDLNWYLNLFRLFLQYKSACYYKQTEAVTMSKLQESITFRVNHLDALNVKLNKLGCIW